MSPGAAAEILVDRLKAKGWSAERISGALDSRDWDDPDAAALREIVRWHGVA